MCYVIYVDIIRIVEEPYETKKKKEREDQGKMCYQSLGMN